MATRFRHWFTLGGGLFGGIKLTKNVDPDKYSYSDYGIGFDTREFDYLTGGSLGKNVVIFEVDMSSSMHLDDTGKDVLILSKGPTQGLNQTLTTETQYSISFMRPGIKFCLSVHYNGSNSFLFVNARYISSKQKILK